jgi:ABC-2 type transport system ATP-binding protein
VLVAEGLTKRYGERLVVDGVGFTIGPGETYGLLGPNGAGKTTTTSMICGLLSRDAGTVRLRGEEFDTRTIDVKAGIGFVPQEIAIYPDLTARENLRFSGRPHRSGVEWASDSPASNRPGGAAKAPPYVHTSSFSRETHR